MTDLYKYTKKIVIQEDVLNNLAENININKIVDVKYTHSVAAENIPALFDMTPLTSNINERGQVKQNLIDENKDLEITLAFKIAVCINLKSGEFL